MTLSLYKFLIVYFFGIYKFIIIVIVVFRDVRLIIIIRSYKN